MALFKLWIFNIDFITILSFIIGIFFGIVLLCLIYALLVLLSLRDKKTIINPEEEMPYEEIKDLIKEAEREYKDKKIRQNQGRVSHCINISRDLAYSIAARFYPKSKYPLLELSVDELIMLLGYIQKKIDDLLNRKALRLLKRIKASLIMSLSKKTTEVLNSKAFQVSKDVSKFASKAKMVLNVINPLNILRKVFVDKTTIIILNKLCIMIINIVAEETYKIYSKHAFNQDIIVESNIDQLESELEQEIKNSYENKDIVNEEKIDYKFMNRYNNDLVINNYKSILDENMKFKESV